MAQNLISQQLASANVDSFALIYNDGTAHFQGSNSAYDLSSIDPIDGANSTIESNENFDDQDPNPEIDWPFRFENWNYGLIPQERTVIFTYQLK